MWGGVLVITVSHPTFCCVGVRLWLRWGWAVTILLRCSDGWSSEWVVGKAGAELSKMTFPWLLLRTYVSHLKTAILVMCDTAS